ncbi:MAG: signal peptidase II [Alphaproteobacteria bacterium]|jgi:signal peptidase II
MPSLRRGNLGIGRIAVGLGLWFTVPVQRWALVLAGLVLVADQLTKWWIVTQVMAPPQVIAVTDFFNIVMVWNQGVTFGLLGTGGEVMRWVLVVVTFGVTSFLLAWLTRTDRAWPAVALGAIIGGAFGNLIDRLVYGKVADFLDFYAFGWHWPAFNLADMAIVCGVAVIIVDAFIVRPE